MPLFPKDLVICVHMQEAAQSVQLFRGRESLQDGSKKIDGGVTKVVDRCQAGVTHTVYNSLLTPWPELFEPLRTDTTCQTVPPGKVEFERNWNVCIKVIPSVNPRMRLKQCGQVFHGNLVAH